MSPTTISDKTPIINTFLLPLIDEHRQLKCSESEHPPFFLGISGPQGSGKTTLVSSLATTLRRSHNLNVVVFSIDDIYLTHAEQKALTSAHPDNMLVAHRGEPGTHDVKLGSTVLEKLRKQETTRIPQYNKSLNGGKGDRVPEAEWSDVLPPYDVVIFEGWCVGFRSLSTSGVESAWKASRANGKGTLRLHELEHVLFVNENLKVYDVMTNQLDALAQLDAQDISHVYQWRKEQEHGSIKKYGSGMTDEEVIRFVNGYMPAYELYVDQLRGGTIGKAGRNLRIVIGENRNPVDILQE